MIITRSRYLIPATEQPRVRRAADATGVALGVLLFLWSWRAYLRVDDVEATVSEIVGSIPDWVGGTISVVYTFGLLYVVGLFLVVLAQWRQRLDAVRDMVLVSVTIAVLATILVRVISGAWPRLLPELGLAESISQFPLFRVTVIAGVLLVVAPHLTRPMRRFGWGVMLLVAAAGVGLGLGLPSSALGALGLGAASAGIVLLIFGSPRGFPDIGSIASALSGLGVDVVDLELADDQSWGVRRLVAVSDVYGRIEVKAYGRDATDSQFFARTWRYLWYRDSAPSLALTRMQSVEHEALVTMMAERTGASVPRVLAAGLGGDDMAILAVDRSGSRLSEMESEEISDDQLVSIWRSVSDLHDGRISHGSLSCISITVTPDGHQIGDFGAGAVAAPESALPLDIVELLVSMARLFGVERAVATARQGLGEEVLSEALPYIQTPGVSARERRVLSKPKAFVREVHDEVARVTNTEDVEQVQIRRVQGKNLLMMAVSLFAVYFLLSLLSDIDFVAVWDEVRSAQWAWIAIGFIVGQFVYFPEATAMLAAVGYPIPLRPVVILQSAIKFISLAVPSSAGRIAMNAAFLRKYGVSFTLALVQGSIDTMSGLAVEVLILLLAIATGSLTLGLGTGEAEWGLILLVLLGVALVVVYLVRRVQRLRDWVLPILGEALGAFREVLKDPKRTLGLLASNFGSRFVLAVSMWLILLSFDVSLGILSVLTATVAAGLIGGVVPIPGGVGVSEAVLTAFLVLFGVEETTAFAAAVIYRMATFYIPSGAGFFSMRWLEKNGYV